MRMWDKSYYHYFLTEHCPLLGKQLIKISEWCSATFIMDIFGQFGKLFGENVIGQNSDLKLQYKLNETELY